MSEWSTITAVIRVDVNKLIDAEEIEAEVRNMLKNAPKITGSEEDAAVFVNKMPGYNQFVPTECDKCEHYVVRKVSKNITKSECDSEIGCTYPGKDYQTNVCITVVGSLRDRTAVQTRKEFLEFTGYIRDNIGMITRKTSRID